MLPLAFPLRHEALHRQREEVEEGKELTMACGAPRGSHSPRGGGADPWLVAWPRAINRLLVLAATCRRRWSWRDRRRLRVAADAATAHCRRPPTDTHLRLATGGDGGRVG